jgi:hypothetical protein
MDFKVFVALLVSSKIAIKHVENLGLMLAVNTVVFFEYFLSVI